MPILNKNRKLAGKQQRWAYNTESKQWVMPWSDYKIIANVQRKPRSDKKYISQTNQLTVTAALLGLEGGQLVTTLMAKACPITGELDPDTLEKLRLVEATRQSIRDALFLMTRCEPSAEYAQYVLDHALRVTFKFLCTFYPEQFSNPKWLHTPPLNTRKRQTNKATQRHYFITDDEIEQEGFSMATPDRVNEALASLDTFENPPESMHTGL